MDKNNKIATLFATGAISLSDLVAARSLIERADFVQKGLEACKKICFPIGKSNISVYSYTDKYTTWGECNIKGIVTFFTNKDKAHILKTVDIFNFEEVFISLDDEKIGEHLERFLQQTIKELEGQDSKYNILKKYVKGEKAELEDVVD